MLRRDFLISIFWMSGATGCGKIDFAAAMGPTKKQFDSIQLGMTEKQVVAILGQPSKRMGVQGGEGGAGRLAIYRWISSSLILTVTFDESGAVIGKQKT